ncbi:hypothetical protein GCM10010219_10660 [Streptomyces netropsis]|nr:hypothetical protein GCM10010219_10660 [Streptomyces netropsis]
MLTVATTVGTRVDSSIGDKGRDPSGCWGHGLFRPADLIATVTLALPAQGPGR